MLKKSYLSLLFSMAVFFVAVAQNNIDKKVADLLSKMTLEEKAGQMLQLDMYNFQNKKSGDSLVIDEAKLIEYLEKYKIGSILNTPRAQTADAWYRVSKQLQEICLAHSRLKIPMIYGIDHIHGATYLLNGTVFPQNINTGATFNPSFAADAGATTALESSDLGHHWVFAPVLDIARNPYYPRFYETYGEDPYVGARMGAAYITALENNPATLPYKQAACAKHFIGYSDPRSGWDRTPTEISEQNLQELFRPAFQAAVDAGVKTFMICSGEVNGVPVHASYPLLTGLLRNQMGFKGVAVTDWEDIILLHKTHRVAESEKEATYMAIMAGIDMSMAPYKTGFYDYLIELVKEGRIPMSRIDLSVSRILRLKFELGLFENPYPRNDRYAKRIGTAESIRKALNSARESIVLIKNEKNTLPLQTGIKTILLAGSNANVKRSLCGGWSYTWQGEEEKWFPANMPTIYDALKKEFPSAKIELVTDTFTKNETAKEAFKSKANRADVVVFAGGEYPYAEGMGNINDLTINESQANMLEFLGTINKPVVCILVEGRPRVVTKFIKNIPAVIWAGLPGSQGATAIAEILSGKTNPSGKMSFTYPSHVGHLVPYNKKNVEKKRMHNGFDTTYTIAEFGTGLSYTHFEYGPISLSDSVLSKDREIKASITVTNTGKVTGKEAVLWYLFDEFRSITPPVKALKYFEKEEIKPGESKTFNFVINPSRDLSFRDASGKLLAEPGYFTLLVGNRSARLKLAK